MHNSDAPSFVPEDGRAGEAAPRGVLGLHGRAEVGKSRLAATIVAGVRHLYIAAAPLPEGDQLALVRESLGGSGVTEALPDDADWPELLHWLRAQRVQAIVFDGLGELLDANRRFLQEVGRGWLALEQSGGGPALVFVDEDADVVRKLTGDGSPFRDPLAGVAGIPSSYEPELHRVEPLPYGRLARRCRGWSAEEIVAGYAIFGGLPSRLRAIDPNQRLDRNVTALVLDPAGPLFSSPLRHLRARFRNATRYGAIVQALARGARSWKALGEHVSELPGPGPLAPYVKRLEALDIVRVERSLDASARSRKSRYRLTDPFDAFWWSHVLPLRARLAAGDLEPARAWSDHVAPRLDEHVARVFPLLCRQFLESYGLSPTGSTTREVGALWGDGYDLPVAGTLTGGAVVYGACHWHGRRPSESWLDRLEEHVRATRYGFGREARLRLLFTREPPTERLRLTLLRSEWIRRVGPTEMVAAARA